MSPPKSGCQHLKLAGLTRPPRPPFFNLRKTLETSSKVREDGDEITFRWMSSGSRAIIPSLINSFTLKEGEKGPRARALASVAILRTQLVIGPEEGTEVVRIRIGQGLTI